MEEPTKSDIDTIFKRLKTLPANKVRSRESYYLNKINGFIFLARYVLIVERKIQHGHQLPMVYSYVLIVQQDIVVLVFISPLFVQLILILAGDGFKFGMLSKNRSSIYIPMFSAMQVGGNANAVSFFIASTLKLSIKNNLFRKHFFNNMAVKPKIYNKNITVEAHSYIVRNFINLLRKQ